MTFLIASITPVIIFIYLIYRKDKLREPPVILVKCFLGGFFICTFGALLLETAMGKLGTTIQGNFFNAFFNAYFVAAGCEEGLKWLVVYWIVWRSVHFDEYYDGIIYAVFVSMGFALLENLLYVWDGGMRVAMMRAVMAVPGHGFFAVAMGYFLSLAKFGPPERRTANLLSSFLIPFMLHGSYDFILMYISRNRNPAAGAVLLFLVGMSVFVIYLWKQGIRKINAHVRQDQQSSLYHTDNNPMI